MTLADTVNMVKLIDFLKYGTAATAMKPRIEKLVLPDYPWAI